MVLCSPRLKIIPLFFLISRYCWYLLQCHCGLALEHGLVVALGSAGGWFDMMSLKVFSNLDNSVIL